MSRISDRAPPFSRRPDAQQPPRHPQVTMRRGVFAVFAGMLVVFGASTAGSVGYLLWRDEALQAISARHASLERSYEAQVSLLRRELDRVNSQRVTEGAAVEARVRELWNRQAQIEKRATILSAIASGGGQTSVEQAARTPPAPAARQVPPGAEGAPVLGFAPLKQPPRATALEALDRAAPKSGIGESATPKPPIDRPALRGALVPGEAPENAPFGGNLAAMAAALDRVEQMQVALAGLAGRRARDQAQRLHALASQIGLPADRIANASSAQGGPFVPLELDPNGSAFDRELHRHQEYLARVDGLRRLLSAAPLRRPVSETAEQTSSFGSRIDPFLGRPAYHTGIDFREAPGSNVFATAPGKVVAAGWNGGYGLMVEIDHGNGISSRYAHLSAILVSEGQNVPAGRSIGRVGNTGRSTGPHLHYEVRIDDEAVDPMRFLQAGVSLANVMSSLDH
ncbi:MAG: peptidoglycan DD-metalloendopeptidase family protein [Beijerinckiaceae bacterium]